VTEHRLLTPARKADDVDAALRPKTLDEFVGQRAARENLRVFIQAAKACSAVLAPGPERLIFA